MKTITIDISEDLYLDLLGILVHYNNFVHENGFEEEWTLSEVCVEALQQGVDDIYDYYAKINNRIGENK